MSLHDRKIPAVGPKDADIYILGESGGKNEAKEQKPFMGRAGRQLNDWLSSANIDRAECRILNAYPWYPKGKKSQAFFRDGDSRLEPTKRFMQGLDELVGDIIEVNPNVVVGLGNYALWSMTQQWGITSWWGSIMEASLVPGQKFIPIIHPAAVLRKYTWKAVAIWHFRRAKEEAKTPEIKHPDRHYITDPTQTQIDRAVKRLLEGDHFTWDTEWYTPEELACIGFTNSPDWAICIPSDHPGALPAYKELLGSNLRKVAQNAFFDVVYTRNAGIEVKTVDEDALERVSDAMDRDVRDTDESRALKDSGENPSSYNAIQELSAVDQIVRRSSSSRLIEDTMVGHHVCWPDLRNRLEMLTSIYTREPYYKEEFKVWESEAAQGLERSEKTLQVYNCKDAAVTEEIDQALVDEKDLLNTGRAYDLNMMTLDIMSRATRKGIRADYAGLMRMREENKREADELHGILCEIVGWKLNVRSWKDVKKLVYGQLGFRERKRRPTAQDTLMDIAAQARDESKQTILKTLIKIRQLKNQNSRYTHPCAVDDDGRIRCSWNMAGTTTGRLSASKDKFKDCPGPGGFKGRGLPLQTIPYKVRKIFVPDPGHVFIIPDLEQAEARIVAYLSEDQRVLRWLDEGLDIHSKLAELMFGADYDEIRAEKKEGESPRRYLAKTCRHALNYRMGPRTFKETVNEDFLETGIGVTESEAKSLRKKYLTIHSPLKAWWNKVKKTLSNNRQVMVSALGRHRKFIGRWGNQLFQAATAFEPQSIVGDLTHMGLYEVDRRLSYADVLLNMHDGSVIQVPLDKAEEAGEVVMDALSIPFEINGYEITIPVELKYGMSWGEPKDTLEELDF